MDKKNIPSAETLRKMAQELREKAKRVEVNKTVKCAKYVLGITALAQLEKKLRSL